jgi:hypothetical protein
MDIKIVLVAQEGNAKRAYLAELESIGVQVDEISSFSEIHKLMSENSYNGVIVDFKTKMKATANEKKLAPDILEQFPFAQLNFEEKAGVNILCYDQMNNNTLKEFINIKCRSFNARKIRLFARKENHFNIKLSKISDFTEKEIDQTVSINVSQGGCFIYSIDNWEISTNVFIVIKELYDKRPIPCEVRRHIAWGETMQIPGIGIKFLDISENQLEDFCKIGHIS